MARILRYVLIGLGIAFVAIQFIPVERSNPPVTALIDAPEDVMTTLRRSCWDCHSNETEWPWYSFVAPISWLVQRDVEEARSHFNVSELGREKNHGDEAGRLVQEGGMPPWFYLPLHPDEHLSDEDDTP